MMIGNPLLRSFIKSIEFIEKKYQEKLCNNLVMQIKLKHTKRRDDNRNAFIEKFVEKFIEKFIEFIVIIFMKSLVEVYKK